MHLSPCFLANDLLLAIYFVCILGYGNGVRQKENLGSFLIWIQMSRKAAETTGNINNAFGPGTDNDVQCSGGSRSLAKETRALKMRSAVARLGKLTMTN